MRLVSVSPAHAPHARRARDLVQQVVHLSPAADGDFGSVRRGRILLRQRSSPATRSRSGRETYTVCFTTA